MDIAKSGDNEYFIFKYKDEIILVIVNPPNIFNGKTSVGGKVNPKN